MQPEPVPSAQLLLATIDSEAPSFRTFALCAHGVERHLTGAHRLTVEAWLLEMLERVTAPKSGESVP